MSGSPARIPGHAELHFARNERTGTVHVLPHELEPWEDGAGPALITSDEGFGFAVDLRTPMLCGTKLHMRPWGTKADRVAEFPDDALCSRCIRALGDQSARAFERPVHPAPPSPAQPEGEGE